jgi:amino acid adenylation domain-containing protein
VSSIRPPDAGEPPPRLRFLDAQLLDAKRYWRDLLARELHPCTVPPDRLMRTDADRRSARHDSAFAGQSWELARKLTKDKPALIHSLVAAACVVLLHKLTGTVAMVIGSPALSGNAESNALPLAIDVRPSLSFRALLAEMHRVANTAYKHQRYPHSAIAHDLGLEVSAQRCALFDLSISHQGLHSSMPATAEDVAIHLKLSADALLLGIAYKPTLYDPGTIEEFANRLDIVLTAALREPDILIAEIDTLCPAERVQILQQWSRAPSSLVFESLHSTVQRRAAQRPDSIAVRCDDIELTYRELDHRSNVLAAQLRDHGVGAESVVGLCLQPCVARVVALLAVLKAGGAFVPLDPEYPRSRLEHMIAETRPRVVVFGDGLRAAIGGVACAVLVLDEAAERLATGAVAVLTTDCVSADNLAYVIYTSGSTGTPKGIACHQRGLANLAAAQIKAFGVKADSRVLQFASFGFDASVSEIAVALAAGAALILAKREMLFPGDTLAQFLDSERISHVTLVPSVLAMLPCTTLPALETIVSAGEACPGELANRWSNTRTFLNAYGPSEITVCATIGRCAHGDPQPSIGRPMANMEVFVLDPGMRLVAPNTEGELYIGGVGVARGYLSNPGATAERFVPHPFAATPGQRLYRTGDRARLRKNGSLDFVGRADTQVKMRGLRIELGEIEAALRRAPQVGDVAVLCREDEPAVKRLVAYIETTPNAQPNEAALRKHLRHWLPPYMAVDAFVFTTALPRTAKGSIGRNALAPPASARLHGAEPTLAARTADELELVQLWERVLERGPIGIRDNFFELGGHSFLAVRLVAEIRDAFDTELRLPDLLQNPTVEQLAASIRQHGTHTARSPLIVLRAGGTQAPLICVHPAGGTVMCYADLAVALGIDHPVYALQAPGLTDGARALHTVEAMARTYLDVILAHQPKGPYMLAGWSSGGLIAYQMAKELKSRGLEVALLALLDTYAPSALSLSPSATHDDVQNLLNLFNGHSALCEADLRELDATARLSFVLDMAKQANLVPADYDSVDARRQLDVFAAMSDAAAVYRPGRYDGKVLLFSARQGTAAAVLHPHDASHGWQPLVDGQLLVLPMPCDHLGLVKPPIVSTVANTIHQEFAITG